MITLNKITEENIRGCLKLDAGDDKSDFVANSFAIAWLNCDMSIPLIINKDNEHVGFILLIMENNRDNSRECYISRFMIDKNHQRKGYAKAALHAVFDYIKRNLDCEIVRISFAPKNVIAKKLYEGLGFINAGIMNNGEIIMTLQTRINY